VYTSPVEREGEKVLKTLFDSLSRDERERGGGKGGALKADFKKPSSASGKGGKKKRGGMGQSKYFWRPKEEKKKGGGGIKFLKTKGKGREKKGEGEATLYYTSKNPTRGKTEEGGGEEKREALRRYLPLPQNRFSRTEGRKERRKDLTTTSECFSTGQGRERKEGEGREKRGLLEDGPSKLFLNDREKEKRREGKNRHHPYLGIESAGSLPALTVGEISRGGGKRGKGEKSKPLSLGICLSAGSRKEKKGEPIARHAPLSRGSAVDARMGKEVEGKKGEKEGEKDELSGSSFYPPAAACYKKGKGKGRKKRNICRHSISCSRLRRRRKEKKFLLGEYKFHYPQQSQLSH